MKRKTAKQILVESFHEIAEKKTIDKITVKDITDNCGYSSATFYRQFKDKYDLIAWDYTRKVEDIMNKIGIDGYKWSQTLIEGAEYFYSQRDYLKNLFLHTSGFDSLAFNMVEINYNYLKKRVEHNAQSKSLNEMTEMYIRLYCVGTVHLTCEWIMGKYNASKEELAQVFENSLPQPLYEYLY